MSQKVCRIFLVGGLALFVAACSDSTDRPCHSLAAGLASLDEKAVREDIDGWLAAYDASNLNGHKENVEAWVQSLRDECGLDATLRCNACIETLPPQSEVSIRLDSSGVTVSRILDISMPATGPMTFRALHL